MSDSFNWDVIIKLATQGAKSSLTDLNKVADAQDRLNKEGKITEKGLETNTKALNRYSTAARDGAGNNDRMAASTNALRYANYDLATTLFTVAGAITAVGAASAVAFASQESAFTTVERIVSGDSAAIGELRAELQTLSTEIPKSFQDLSGIASLGAALDIPAQKLAKFTETVAKFAATTGVSTEAAATGFGKLSAYLKTDDYDALGSAILKAGNISVATEEQVLKFSQALALPAARAGLLSDQVIALGATIASFANINVEGAGSALSRIFANIDRSVAEGGDSLERFSKISGNTAAQFGIQWKTNAGDTFNQIVRGLAGDVEHLVANMDALGIVNERDRRVISALALNYGKYQSILTQTTSAWREGIYMNEAYGLVLDDLSSKWTVFLNAVTNAAAAVGSAVTPALGQLLDVTTDLLVGFAGFADSDLGAVFFRLVAGLAVLIAAWAALRGVVALATASTLAFKFATSLLTGPGIIAGLRGLGLAMGFITTNANGATVAAFTLRGALLAIGRATIIIGILQLIVSAVLDLGGTVEWAGGLLREFGNLLVDLSAMGQGMGGNWQKGAAQIRDAGKAVQEWSKTLPRAEQDQYGLNNATAEGAGYMADFEDSLPTGGLGDLGDALDDTATKVRTLTDYSSDLASVWSRAFEIRFSAQTTMDGITKSLLDIRNAAEEARRRIAGLEAEISGIQSDVNIQKRFLSIAIEYGDTTRAEAIQANLAKLQADLADKTAELTVEQDKNNKTLLGNTAGAIANRETIKSLVQQYQAHLQALANSGLTQDQLAVATELLRQDFINQATQLGYNVAELGFYETAFYDVKTAIDNVPRDITVNFNPDPALQALNEFAARAQAQMSTLGNSLGNTLASGIQQGVDSYQPPAYNPRSQWNPFSSSSSGGGSSIGSLNPSALVSAFLLKLLAGGGFAGGGYTGPGGTLQPAGLVHRGEYVVPKRDVNQRTGLPYADAMGRLQRGTQGRSGYAGGGFVTPSSSGNGYISAFGPMAQQQLMTALRQIVTLDGKVISDNSAANYAHSTSQGEF